MPRSVMKYFGFILPGPLPPEIHPARHPPEILSLGGCKGQRRRGYQQQPERQCQWQRSNEAAALHAAVLRDVHDPSRNRPPRKRQPRERQRDRRTECQQQKLGGGSSVHPVIIRRRLADAFAVSEGKYRGTILVVGSKVWLTKIWKIHQPANTHIPNLSQPNPLTIQNGLPVVNRALNYPYEEVSQIIIFHVAR